MSIGGAVTTVPEMHRFLVSEQAWLSEGQFSNAIALAQAAPGPNVLFVAVLGWTVGMNAAGGSAAGAAAWSLLDLLPQALQRGLYRVALERGFEEMAVMRGVVGPVWRLLKRLAAAERAWTAWLGEKRDGSTGSKQREVRR